ncbi:MULTISPECIES: CDGSH iron-sulfur domain-containing protein [Pseudonocardia]
MPAEPTRMTLTDDGPVLVHGPVEIETADGRRIRSDRPVTAVCTCRRTRRPPFCDTSHRTRVREGERT